jgi:hypothetical protein
MRRRTLLNEANRLQPDDGLRSDVVGPGDVRFVRDPLEALDELAHEFAGIYAPGYLQGLRDEWDDL